MDGIKFRFHKAISLESLSKALLLVAFILFFGLDGFSQTCPSQSTQGAFPCSSRSPVYSGQINIDSGNFQFKSIIPYSPGTYFKTSVLQGGCYFFEVCNFNFQTSVAAYQVGDPINPIANNRGGSCDRVGGGAFMFLIPSFSGIVDIDVRQNTCSPGGISSNSVRMRQNNNLSFTNSFQPICAGDTLVLTATPTPVGAAAPSGSGDPGSFSGPHVIDNYFIPPASGNSDTLTYAITYSFGFCSITQDIQVYQPPTTSNLSGPINVLCGVDSVVINGNTPTVGAGYWQVVSGPGILDDSTQNSTTLKNLDPNTPTVVRWTIKNGPCESSSEMTVNVINDTQAPAAPSLNREVVDCNGSLTVPTAFDACEGTIMGTTSYVLNYVEGDSTLVTWSFDDGNGNVSTASQYYVYDDVSAPIPPTLSRVVVDCNDTLIPPNAFDSCVGLVQGSPSNPNYLNALTSDGDSVEVTWSFSDGNGNLSFASQYYVFDDQIAPVQPVLNDVTIDCNGSLITPNTTDNCVQNVLGTTSTSLNYVEGDSTFVTWTFDDGNGNSVTASQWYFYKDTTLPSITLNSVSIECTDSLITPVATDNCSGSIIGTTNDVLNYIEGDSTLINWTFDDGNGNILNLSQTYYFDDVTAPAATPNLPTLTFDCNDTLVAPTALDNCSGTITATTMYQLNFNDGTSTVINWFYDDGNGNIAASIQTIIFDDTTKPLAPIIPPKTVGCTYQLFPPTATDNCLSIIYGNTNDVVNFVEGGTQTITWTFDDGNGNISTAQEVLIFDDTIPPTIISPLQPVVVDCQADISQFSAGAFDTCTFFISGPVVGFTNDSLNFSEGDTTIVTWVYDDGNGNQTLEQQLFIYDDTTAPAAPASSGITFYCGDTLTPPTALDDCAGQVAGSTNDVINFVSGSSQTILWEYDDGNGNSSFSAQTLNFSDTTAPVVPNLSNVTVDCNGSLSIPSANDLCAGTINGTTNDVLNFVEGDSTIITWSFDDGNGNISSVTQTYFYDDITAPVPDQANLADISALCEVISITAPSATDNCAANVNVSSDAVLPITSVGTTVVTWTYDDGNGNTTTQTQNVIISGYAVTASIQSGTTIQSDQTGDTYQWIDCSNNQAIAGETNQTYTATANGDYAVIVTDQNCVDTSNCVNITGVNLSRTVNTFDILIYPNPAVDGRFTVISSKEIVDIELYDLLGRDLTLEISKSKNHHIDASNLKSAEYILKVYFKEDVETRKIHIK